MYGGSGTESKTAGEEQFMQRAVTLSRIRNGVGSAIREVMK